MEYRAATAADADRLIAFWAVAGENDGRPTDTVDAVLRLLERDPDALIVAVDGDRIVGTIIAGWDGWRSYFHRLAVHPDARRRGIARELLARAEARVRELGAPGVGAMVLEHNELGATAWAAGGYRRQDDWRRWVLRFD